MRDIQCAFHLASATKTNRDQEDEKNQPVKLQ